MSTPQPTTYTPSVTALTAALSTLTSAVSTLSTGVSDHPRTSLILRSIRHYELIPSPSLARAEASLRDEIGPAVQTLLDRADAQLERQARRIETLKARAELQAGRLSHGGEERKSVVRKTSVKRGTGMGRKLDGEAGLRAKMVRSRREALKYGVERMELELEQKERELRARLGAGE